ncbi:ribonuclease H-like domain-containing protein [Crassaminicella profunda]|uniref:ribonuclease H-like domain-containing protein n=1 Tax=Crassaminicella profunda TaxID=1286698 RepID=UPI001CA78AA3|nr:ribonuclease H-like domain-containing protein [Crassaminicella profunda]QZY56355.1 ribonuclease H-like domain-containing protein [Crassaminicella profunda]
MEIIQYNLDETLHLPKNFVSLYGDVNFAIFDIETTGLSPHFHKVILIGLLYIKNGKISIQQFFSNNKKEEAALLSSFKDKIQEFDLLIDYNGNTFDIPFLNKRFLANKIDYSIATYQSIDLLKLIRKIQKQLHLDNCKLKSVEEYLNIHRNDKISGKESVALYNQYEKEQTKKLKDTILLHNYDDLYYFSKALMILDQIPIEQMIQNFPQIFHIGEEEKRCYILKQHIKNSSFYLEGVYKNNHIDDYISYENGFSFEYKNNTNTFTVKIPLYKGRLSSGVKCLYVDTNDFSFAYEKNTLDHLISENIILFKQNNNIKFLDIHLFISKLIPYILNKIENI